jgi:hypothetical protein
MLDEVQEGCFNAINNSMHHEYSQLRNNFQGGRIHCCCSFLVVVTA